MAKDFRRAVNKARSEGILAVLRILPQYITKKGEELLLPSSSNRIEYKKGTVTIIPNRSLCEKELYKYKEYEPEIDKRITQALSSGDIAIDVGAHVGHHTVSMRLSVGESGRVLSIEPDPSRMNVLEQTIQDNEYENVKLIKAGVSDRAETTKLDRSDVPQITSGSIEHDMPPTTIQTITLDKIFEDKNIDNADLVKIDIEGHEAKALAGTSIERIDTLIIEIHPDKLGKEDLETLIRKLYKFDKITNVETNKKMTDLQSAIKPEHDRLHLYCEKDPK